MKNPDGLNDRQATTLAAIQAGGGKLARAWAMKEMVRAIFAPGLTVGAVNELLDRLLAHLSRCRLRPFIRLGKTIRKHREGILAARRLKLSNARAEAQNNKVKLIVRRAYGFHSAQAALALVHLTCGPVTRTLPHEQASRDLTYDHARRAVFLPSGSGEVRGRPRDFLYSKLMCWVALDRAVALSRPPRRLRPSRGMEADPETDL